MQNISDNYDSYRISDIAQNKDIDGKRHTNEDIRDHVISMEDAINIVDGKRSDADLNANQKGMVEWVRQERQTPEGITATNTAAADQAWLRYDTEMHGGKTQPGNENVIIINPDDSNIVTKDRNPQSVLHHELTHEGTIANGKSIPAADLSSFDKKLDVMGNEGRAFVAQEEDRRERADPPESPMTDEEKRKFFVETVGKNPGYFGQLLGQSRLDGRHMTMDEFADKFGTIPGHEDHNFLKGAGYKDPADLFDQLPDSQFHQLRMAAETKPLSAQEMPKASASVERFDSDNKQFIVLVRHEEGQKEKIEIYQHQHREEKVVREYAGGPGYVVSNDGYVKVKEKEVGPDDRGNDRELVFVKMVRTELTGVDVTAGGKDKPDVTVVAHHSWDDGKSVPITFHKIEPESAPAIEAPKLPEHEHQAAENGVDHARLADATKGLSGVTMTEPSAPSNDSLKDILQLASMQNMLETMKRTDAASMQTAGVKSQAATQERFT